MLNVSEYKFDRPARLGARSVGHRGRGAPNGPPSRRSRLPELCNPNARALRRSRPRTYHVTRCKRGVHVLGDIPVNAEVLPRPTLLGRRREVAGVAFRHGDQRARPIDANSKEKMTRENRGQCTRASAQRSFWALNVRTRPSTVAVAGAVRPTRVAGGWEIPVGKEQGGWGWVGAAAEPRDVPAGRGARSRDVSRGGAIRFFAADPFLAPFALGNRGFILPCLELCVDTKSTLVAGLRVRAPFLSRRF